MIQVHVYLTMRMNPFFHSWHTWTPQKRWWQDCLQTWLNVIGAFLVLSFENIGTIRRWPLANSSKLTLFMACNCSTDYSQCQYAKTRHTSKLMSIVSREKASRKWNFLIQTSVSWECFHTILKWKLQHQLVNDITICLHFLSLIVSFNVSLLIFVYLFALNTVIIWNFGQGKMKKSVEIWKKRTEKWRKVEKYEETWIWMKRRGDRWRNAQKPWNKQENARKNAIEIGRCIDLV